MRQRRVVALALGLICFFAACSRGGPETKSANAGQGNKAADATGIPPRSPFKLAIDDATLAITGAFQLAQKSQWQDTARNLQGAKVRIEAALKELPDDKRMLLERQQLEDVRDRIDRAIKSAENGDKDTTAQVQYLQTAIFGIKVQYAS